MILQYYCRDSNISRDFTATTDKKLDAHLHTAVSCEIKTVYAAYLPLWHVCGSFISYHTYFFLQGFISQMSILTVVAHFV